MIQNSANDFGALYRSAFAERDPERKQMLLSQVQKAINNSKQKEPVPMAKLSAQSLSSASSEIAAAA